MTQITQGPPKRPVDPIAFATRKRAALGAAVWEASQIMEADAIRAHVEGTLREIEVDRP